ncbi:MAG: anion permease [Parachlamydiaceae bacterium]|nr:anion permease [Parachlamydiaceae bacterium]
MTQPNPAKKIFFKGANVIPLTLAVVASLIVWLIPTPANLEPRAWQLFAVFVGLITGLIGKALPMGGISFLALTILIVSHTLTVKEAFSGFGNPIVWLVVAAFLLSRSFIKTGLGMRLAYHLVALLGNKTLGLGYGIAATELLLAPAIPSNTARSGGVIFPIVRALAISFNSTPEKHSQRLMGGFLTLVAFYSNLITSAMFITAMAANPLIAGILLENGMPLTWSQWALAASLPGLLSLLLMPYIVYRIYPPEITHTPGAKRLAHEHLEVMGKMSKYEWITALVFIVLIFLWMFGELFAIDSTTVALFGVCIFLITGVLTWNDIKEEHEAWDTLVWFSTLLMIAGFLNQFGLTKWASAHIHFLLDNMEWWMAWPLLVSIYFYMHYCFASNTAHVSSMYAAVLGVGIALRIPPYLIGLSLAFCSSLFACLTHYGTGCAPILFGSEYVNLRTWWRMGAIMSVVFLLIWVGLGSMWWKFLGWW